MRVLFLTTNWPSEASPINGVFVREHARAAAQHAQVEVLSLERTASARGIVDVVPGHDDELPAWRVRYRRFGRPLSYLAFVLGSFIAYRRLRQRGFDPDVLHANSFLSALPALLLGRLYGRPVVYTEHWSVFLRDSPATLSSPMRLAARFALERADMVLPVSQALADGLHELAPAMRLRVVRNVVDEELFRADAARGGRPLRLLTAGLLDNDAKGVDLLIESLALLSDSRHVRLDVVGDGRHRARYEALSHGVASTILFHGLVPKRELAQLMRDADLFVLASRYDNNPCVLLEALASGLPVVATRVGGVPEIVGADDGVLVEPSEPAALAAAIDEAIAHLDRFDRAAIARRAVDRYGRSAVAEQLAEIYAEVTEKRSGSLGTRP